MAFGSRTISVEILGDSSSLERAFTRSAKSGQKMNVAFAGVGKAAAGAGLAFFGAQGVLRGLEESVAISSNLTEQTAKSRQIFQRYSGDLEKWAKGTAESFGIANDQALEAAGTFGNLFRTVHIAPAEAAAMSRSLTELAADLASFNNAPVDDALLALRSGLVGEAEPLRRFGVRLSEVRVQQEALAATGKKNVKALTEQEKALARVKIILDDTKIAQGDFARTSDGFANKVKKLEASFRDLKGELGTGLIPALTAVVDMTAFAIRKTNDLGRAYADLPSTNFLEGVGGKIFDIANKFGYGANQADAYADALARVAERTRLLGTESLQAASRAEENRLGLAAEFAEEAKLPTKKYSAEQANEWWDAKIGRERDRVQDIENLTAQVAELKRIAKLIENRIAATKDVTRKLNLEDELLQVQRDIRSSQERIRERREALAEERKELAKERAEREALARETAQFRRLGFGPGGADLVPGIDALEKRLGRVRKAIEGTFLNTRKTRSMLKAIQSVLGQGIGNVSEEVRSKIEQMLADIDRKLGEHANRRRRRHRLVDTDDVLAGLGLSREQIRILSGRVGQIGKGGTVPLGGASAFGGIRLAGGGGGAVYNLNGPVVVRTDNPDALARELQKRARRQATQTRGSRPGSRQSVD